jgi:hypothetical protein
MRLSWLSAAYLFSIIHHTPLIWRLQAPDQGSMVEFFLFPRLTSIMKGALLQMWWQSKSM